MLGLQILEDDVIEVLRQHFSFAGRFYDYVDEFQRQHALTYNCALIGARHRTLRKSPSTGRAIRMSMRGDETVIIHAQPREIGRAVLASPGDEVERNMELLRRRMQE